MFRKNNLIFNVMSTFKKKDTDGLYDFPRCVAVKYHPCSFSYSWSVASDIGRKSSTCTRTWKSSRSTDLDLLDLLVLFLFSVIRLGCYFLDMAPFSWMSKNHAEYQFAESLPCYLILTISQGGESFEKEFIPMHTCFSSGSQNFL